MQSDEALISAAAEVISRLGDGNRHTVAAAIRTASGDTFVGVNVYALGGGAHAELSALAMAISAGQPEIEVLVAVGDNGRGVIGPCGLCRQMLLDYAPNAEMIVPWNGVIMRVPIPELLPNGERSYFVE